MTIGRILLGILALSALFSMPKIGRFLTQSPETTAAREVGTLRARCNELNTIQAERYPDIPPLSVDLCVSLHLGMREGGHSSLLDMSAAAWLLKETESEHQRLLALDVETPVRNLTAPCMLITAKTIAGQPSRYSEVVELSEKGGISEIRPAQIMAYFIMSDRLGNKEDDFLGNKTQVEYALINHFDRKGIRGESLDYFNDLYNNCIAAVRLSEIGNPEIQRIETRHEFISVKQEHIGIIEKLFVSSEGLRDLKYRSK